MGVEIEGNATTIQEVPIELYVPAGRKIRWPKRDSKSFTTRPFSCCEAIICSPPQPIFLTAACALLCCRRNRPHRRHAAARNAASRVQWPLRGMPPRSSGEARPTTKGRMRQPLLLRARHLHASFWLEARMRALDEIPME